MKTHFTHCALRLGDNLAHLHFLRKLAIKYPADRFVHFAHENYFPQLEEVVADLRSISLVPLPAGGSFWDAKPDHRYNSVDGWKNAGGFFERHPGRLKYSDFMIVFFQDLAGRMGLESPIETAEDLLFDYPALKLVGDPFRSQKWILVINSSPLSGQARSSNPVEMADLILALQHKHGGSLGPVVYTQVFPGGSALGRCTAETDMSVTQIGKLSQWAEVIVMISTGPSWPTFNVWNRDSVKLRIVINEPEIVDLDPRARHCTSAGGAREILMAEGYL